MSLVAYGSSDESESEEENIEHPQKEENEKPLQNLHSNNTLKLPAPKTVQNNNTNGESFDDINEQKLNFDAIPKPKQTESEESINIIESDNATMPKKINYSNIERPPKKEKGPARISIPSLSDFKDLEEEENAENRIKIKPSQKGSGLIGLLPPPKSSVVSTKTNTMVPHVLTKKPIESKKVNEMKKVTQETTKRVQNLTTQDKPSTVTLNSLSSYNSDSEDEDDKKSSSIGIDFFSLSTPTTIPDELLPPISSIDMEISTSISPLSKSDDALERKGEPNKTLSSTVMNLPKEDILLKNKAEIGPKLPVPEQEFNVDPEGNVAFDEKAIEYLCGKRGVKRKNELENIDIVEINGEDIKPDEREWLVKALTEEPVRRPVSINAGPSGQSRKKHQITYLAHQAKANELELKNNWAQSRASRQQTRSKYGF